VGMGVGVGEEQLAIGGEVGGRTLKLSLGVGLCCCIALVLTAGAMPFVARALDRAHDNVTLHACGRWGCSRRSEWMIILLYQ
jgi:hypothetical protein